MENQSDEITKKIDHLFRHEHGKLVSVLTKTFGSANIKLAEDVVQDALLEAVKQWTYKGIPENPSGWIYKIAKNKAVNIVNHEQNRAKFTSEIAYHLQSEWTVRPALDQLFSEKEIEDDQLRMMFTCCHPSISSDSQIALTLKTLCGFSIPEISKAFLTSEESINKRLVRARKKIREAEIPFEVPLGNELQERLSTVLETIYLLFNEGYNSTSGNELIKLNLCEDAIRLVEIIISNDQISEKLNAHALISLMCLNTARFKSRSTDDELLVSLEFQDRSLWNQELIKKGLLHLEFSTKGSELSIYHFLAAISAHHCSAEDYKSTDWKSILNLYEHLMEIDSSPIIQLNHAIILSKAENPKASLKSIEAISDEPFFKDYLPYYTVFAEIQFQNNQINSAINTLNDALKLPLKEANKSLICNKIQFYSHKK